MYRQMMKRKHPSSSPLLEEEEAKRMADSVALELERGIRLSPKKRPRTAPTHDPFFVGTPEEEALHMQRLEGRKRKSEDFSAGDEMQQQPKAASAEATPSARGCKIARRSREQMSAVDIDTLNRQLSTVGLSDTADTNANPCRALALYSPDPFASPTITSTDDLPDLNDESSGPEASLLSRYRGRFPFKRIEDLSKALIIYPEEHPLQPVIDKIKDYERRTGRSNVRIEELNASSLDDIDDDHSACMVEEQNAYLVDEDNEEELELADNEEDSEYGDHGEVEDGLVKEVYPSIPAEERFEVLTDSAFMPTPSTTTSTPSSLPFFGSSTSFSSPFTSTSTTPSSPSSFSSFSSSSLPSRLFSPSPASFGATSSFAPSSLFENPTFSLSSSSSSSSSAFLSAPPVFSNISPFSSSSSPFAPASFSLSS